MRFCPFKGFLSRTFAVCHEVSVACISEEACGLQSIAPRPPLVNLIGLSFYFLT